MCGLILAQNNITPAKSIIKRYEKQKLRGNDGFGFIVIKDGKIINIERAEKERVILRKLKEQSEGEVILFHHRFPTSTPNIEESTHPILVEHPDFEYKYYVMHNGVINNDDELKSKHYRLGFKYNTKMTEKLVLKTPKKKYITEKIHHYNDSEAFSTELARVLEGKTFELDVKGTIAFFALQVDKKDNVINIIYGRNYGNPLKWERSQGFFSLSSECGRYDIDPHKLYIWNLKTGETKEKDFEIGSSALVGYSTKEYEEDMYGYDTSGAINAYDRRKNDKIISDFERKQEEYKEEYDYLMECMDTAQDLMNMTMDENERARLQAEMDYYQGCLDKLYANVVEI